MAAPAGSGNARNRKRDLLTIRYGRLFAGCAGRLFLNCPIFHRCPFALTRQRGFPTVPPRIDPLLARKPGGHAHTASASTGDSSHRGSGVLHRFGDAEAVGRRRTGIRRCTQEMMRRGDFIVPTFNHHLWTDKPVFLYWLQMASFRAFGETEFAARFPCALLAITTALLTYHLGRRLFRPEVGLWAGLIIATTVSFTVIGRAAAPDSPLIFCTTLSLVAYVFGMGKEMWNPESAEGLVANSTHAAASGRKPRAISRGDAAILVVVCGHVCADGRRRADQRPGRCDAAGGGVRDVDASRRRSEKGRGSCRSRAAIAWRQTCRGGGPNLSHAIGSFLACRMAADKSNDHRFAGGHLGHASDHIGRGRAGGCSAVVMRRSEFSRMANGRTTFCFGTTFIASFRRWNSMPARSCITRSRC